MKGYSCPNISQISTIRTQEVAGSFPMTLHNNMYLVQIYTNNGYILIEINPSIFAHLTNNVVITSKMDKLTVTAASKQIGLKKVVAQDNNNRRNEGRQVVKRSLTRRRLNTIFIFKPFVGVPDKLFNIFTMHQSIFSCLQYHYFGILDSMTVYNIESTLLQTAFPFRQEGAQHCVCQIYPPVDRPGISKSCRHQIIIPHVVEHKEY